MGVLHLSAGKAGMELGTPLIDFSHHLASLFIQLANGIIWVHQRRLLGVHEVACTSGRLCGGSHKRI